MKIIPEPATLLLRKNIYCLKTRVAKGSGIILSLFLVCPLACMAVTPSFRQIPISSTGSSLYYAEGVSADGKVVVGWSGSAYNDNRKAFRWSLSDGYQELGDLPGGRYYNSFGMACGVSGNGSVVVGRGESAYGYEGFRWTSGSGMEGLGDWGGNYFHSEARAVSADGSTIIGQVYGAWDWEAFRWTQSEGMVCIGDLAGGEFWSDARDVSADGGVIVGQGTSSIGSEPFIWRQGQGMRGLGRLSGSSWGWANAVSPNGSSVVGQCAFAGTGGYQWIESFLWTESIGMQNIGEWSVSDISVNGIAVGARPETNPWIGTAAIWDAQNGTRNLGWVLENEYGLNLNGWYLSCATGISADGTTIVGYGANPYQQQIAWIATIPEPATLLLLSLGGIMLRKCKQ